MIDTSKLDTLVYLHTLDAHIMYYLKGNATYLKNIYIMDENDSLSEYNKIPLGHNRTNGVVYSVIDFKVVIWSAH